MLVSDMILTCLYVLCIFIIVYKICWKLTTKWNRSYVCLIGKTAIITGANTGIGYFTALDFAKRGARVILACRNRHRAEEAQERIIKATGNENVVYKLIDMASFQSVRDFAKDINHSEERLDILVNNAGILYSEMNYTEDGIESVLQTNHFSPFLLTHLLIDKLKKSAPSRIVNVASNTVPLSKLNIDNVDTIDKVPLLGKGVWKAYRDVNSYFNSKLCNMLFTIELAKKLYDTGVTANTVHPGVIHTDLFRNLSGIFALGHIIGWLFLLTPDEGAQTQIHVSISKEIEGVNGKFFTNCSETSFYRKANNPDLAKKLWKKSEELCKLNPNEKL